MRQRLYEIPDSPRPENDVGSLNDFIRRGGETQRFHTWWRARPETVGQHVYGGLGLLYILTEGRPSLNLIWAWTFHDVGEHIAGDIPSPSKRAGGYKTQFDAYEARIVEAAGFNHAALLTPEESAILSLVDTLDGVFSCLEELQKGNATFDQPYHAFFNYAASAWNKAMPVINGTTNNLLGLLLSDTERQYNQLNRRTWT